MEEIVLERDRRLALRAEAHHLDPVVLLGANGLTDAVLKEIDRELTAHELIKVRVPSDDREERESIYREVAEKLGAARVQMIGKLLIFWRPSDAVEEEADQEDERLAELFRGKASVAGRRTATEKNEGKALKKTGAKKAAKSTYAPVRRARPKRKRVTKKAAGSKA